MHSALYYFWSKCCGSYSEMEESGCRSSFRLLGRCFGTQTDQYHSRQIRLGMACSSLGLDGKNIFWNTSHRGDDFSVSGIIIVK